MGVIYRATDTVLDREVAVKVLHDKYAPDSGAAHRFAGEAHIAAQLQHPGIPPVHDLGALANGQPFLAMKLIKGGTLDVMLAARPNPDHDRGRFVAIFERVCQALAYAHAHGVIHRDLKPANIMVGAFGEVQVMDWGLAKILGSRERERPEDDPQATTGGTEVVSLRDSDGSFTQAGSVLGTPAYMPPEQAVGAIGKVDERSDVFGLGAILAVILTGNPPFAAASTDTTRVKAAQGDVADCFARLEACGAEPELVALCKQCLSPRPVERPADAGQVAAAVANLRQAAEERARRAELDRVRTEGEMAAAELRAAERRKRRRVQRALSLALGLLLLGAVGFGWWQAEQGRATRERLARNAEAVAGLLEQCRQALRTSDAARAAVTLEVTQKRAAEGGAEELAEELRRCEEDLTVLRDLDAVDQFRWTWAGNRFPGVTAVAARCCEALGRFGADPDAADMEQVVERLSDSAVRRRLVTALDRVLLVQKSTGVREALRAIDSDPFRDAVRDAVRAGNLAALAKLAERPEALQQPPGFAAILGENQAVSLKRRRELLTAAVQQNPNDVGLLIALGNSYPIDRWDVAETRARWFQAAVAVDQANPAAHNNLGTALLARRDVDGAIAEFKEAIRLDPKLALAHGNLGNALKDKGDLEGSIAAYKESIRLDPKYAYAHNGLGGALRAKGDPEEAIAAFKEAIKFLPKYVFAQIGLGNALMDKGDVEGAIAAYKQAIGFNPKYAPAHTALGNALRTKGDVEGAIAAYKEALRLDPRYSFAYHGLGNALYIKRDPEGAIAAYKQAIQLSPRFPDAYNGLGNALRARGDLEGAITAYKESIRLNPKFAYAHDGLGNTLKDKGDLEGAIAAYKEALRLNPKLAQTHSNLGLALQANRDLEGAIASHKEAIRLDPKLSPAYNNLGTALLTRRDFEGAITVFRQAIRLAPKASPPRHNLGIALMATGDLEGAVASYEEALRLDPRNTGARTSLPMVRRMRDLLPRLPDVLAGKDKPRSHAEACDFARLCAQPFQKQNAAAVRLYSDAFAADAKLADDLSAGHRYNAACYAARTARGDGIGAPDGAMERSVLRGKALAWLQADLVLHQKQAVSTEAGARRATAAKLSYWLRDPDLSGVRPETGHRQMPAEERSAWDKLWGEVKATIALAQKPVGGASGK
jgi:tetratricopeptide (TPR) repeat protein